MIPESFTAHFREQAGFCRFLGSPFMEGLCLTMARDIEAGGPVARLVNGWPGDPRRDAVSLRIAGYLHHCVLTGTAAELAAAYPAANAGWTMETVWPVARDWLARNEDAARAFMASPPQTNETRRAIALLPGFLKAAARFPGPMHLFELGASAGLNQCWDRFHYRTETWQRAGSSDVMIDTDWRGPPPEHLDAAIEVASRAACDQSPVDVTDPAAAIRLKSYAWPDQPARLARIDAAIGLAREAGVKVEKADAAEWLAAKLAARPETGLTLVFHSVFLQYPPADTQKALRAMIAEAGAAATEARPLAWVCVEPGFLFDDSALTEVNPNLMVSRYQAWPGGELRHFLTADGHITRAQPLP
ncbi:DUF2332 domain-containing protein [Hyphomonas sp.]|uniref:DUF2332 domain-containing protein n=1 Tax=Hyphomonas sp. TaxID=87 RepID=UPI003919E53E